MNPNLQTPQSEQVPSDTSIGGMQAQVQPTTETQPQVQPEVQPSMPFEQPMPAEQPVQQPIAQPVMAQPQPQLQPVQAAQTFQPTSDYSQPSGDKASGLMGILNEKAGLLSLAVFMVMFLILSIATVIDINHLLSTLKAQYEAYGYSAASMPSLFEWVKESIKHWVFVNPLSTWWWALGLAPALALAGFGLFKSKLKSIPAMVTIVLVAEVYINLIVK